MTSSGWLIDKSAYVRLSESGDAGVWADRINRGLVRVATVTVLEIGFSARSAQSWKSSIEQPPLSLISVVVCTPRAERRAVEVQGLLSQRGQHRAPSIPDLLIAAIAETAGLTVLHDDKDFDLIAQVTGQPVERLRPEP